MLVEQISSGFFGFIFVFVGLSTIFVQISPLDYDLLSISTVISIAIDFILITCLHGVVLKL